MRVLGLLTFAILALLPLATKVETVTPFITVTGEVSVSAVPDEARITAGVVTDAKTVGAALDANSEAMTRVFAALKKLNVPDRAIRTSSFSLQPQYAPGNVPYDTSRASAVIDALIAAGANQAGGIAFDLKDNAQTLAQARQATIAGATERAQTYAKAAGITLGRIQSISEGGEAPSEGRLIMLMAAQATPIAAGLQSVSASATVT